MNEKLYKTVPVEDLILQFMKLVWSISKNRPKRTLGGEFDDLVVGFEV